MFACRRPAALPTLESQGGESHGFLVTLFHALNQLSVSLHEEDNGIEAREGRG